MDRTAKKDEGELLLTAQISLAEAQVSEKTGDWMAATAKRGEALRQVLEVKEPPPIPVAQNPTDDLENLGEIHKPTKRKHNYLRRYWRHFRDTRENARKVVEIGVQSPKSISMWEEFFPNATIFGIDIDPACAKFTGNRKKVFVGDQMNESFLLNFIQETGGDFDVVIDDGLHTPYSMLRSFSYLYPALQSHGVYVIEDIMRQPEITSFLHDLMNCVNYVPPGFDLKDWPKLMDFGSESPWVARNTVGVSMYRYLAFIERGFNPGDNRFLRTDEEHAVAEAVKQQRVMDCVQKLKSEGVAPTRENLIARLGPGSAAYVDVYFHNITRS